MINPNYNLILEPVMTIVGAMPTLSFLKYLIKCLCLQTDIATYGRIKIFAVMRPSHYAVSFLFTSERSVINIFCRFLPYHSSMFILKEPFPLLISSQNIHCHITSIYL